VRVANAIRGRHRGAATRTATEIRFICWLAKTLMIDRSESALDNALPFANGSANRHHFADPKQSFRDAARTDLPLISAARASRTAAAPSARRGSPE